VLIEDILDTLSREGLQSDERFAESFVHHRVNNGQGPNKINQELRQRGVEQVLIEIFLESDSYDWMSLAKEVRLKKYGENIPEDYQKKAKQSRFLYSRGFSGELINQLLK
jgi:regulatory protein